MARKEVASFGRDRVWATLGCRGHQRGVPTSEQLPWSDYRAAQQLPHAADAYPWCVIACFNDAHWDRLVQAMGCPA